MLTLTRLSEINSGLVDILEPKHAGISCSDTVRGNGIKHQIYLDRQVPSCYRCALLDILEHEGGTVPEDVDVRVTVEVSIE